MDDKSILLLCISSACIHVDQHVKALWKYISKYVCKIKNYSLCMYTYQTREIPSFKCNFLDFVLAFYCIGHRTCPISNNRRTLVLKTLWVTVPTRNHLCLSLFCKLFQQRSFSSTWATHQHKFYMMIWQWTTRVKRGTILYTFMQICVVNYVFKY